MTKQTRTASIPDGAEKDEKVDPATRIVRLVTQAQTRLFHNADYQAFAKIYVSGHWETWRTRDSSFKRWLSGLYYSKEGTTPSDQNVGAALNGGQSRSRGPQGERLRAGRGT